MSGKMPVSALEELMAARGHPLPRYQEEGFGTSFTCTVYVEGITAVGHGTSKKTAKHESAKKALEILQSPDHQKIAVKETAMEQPLQNYVGKLNEYCSKNSFPYPVYEFVTALVDGKFIMKCTLLKQEVQGVGMTKKDAKQIAARNMLAELATNNNKFDKADYLKMHEKPAKQFLEHVETDRIIEMFNKISVQKQQMAGLQESTSDESSAAVSVEEDEDTEQIPEDDETAESLERALKQLNIEFTLKELQVNPYIISLVVKDTNITFFGVGDTKEEARIKALKHTLTCKKSGHLNAALNSFA